MVVVLKDSRLETVDSKVPEERGPIRTRRMKTRLL